MPVFLLDSDWSILFIPVGIWTAFLSKCLLPKWLEKANWVRPGSRRVVINTIVGLTFALAVFLFGTLTVPLFLAYMVTSVWILPVFDSVFSETR